MEISLDRVGEARAVLIAGPTASGKSAAALRLAEASARRGRSAWIVNADSMQVYEALRILTARPGAAEEARAPHRLYGHVRAETRYSVGAWLTDIAAVLAQAQEKGALAIIVGGTGLYFKALTEGLATIPPVDAGVRTHWLERLAADGAATLHAELATRDAGAAAAIRPSDSQRILRALEVVDATGRSLADWQQAQPAPLLPTSEAMPVVIEPDRDTLYRRIEERFDRMIKAGALEEVRAVLARKLQPQLPVMKAIGVGELAAVLRKDISLEEGLARAKAATRRYAKRQSTWFRHQMRDWERVSC
jgi:tRNA dimethylallyltransferase